MDDQIARVRDAVAALTGKIDAALTVFEEAHTPTDNERTPEFEALEQKLFKHQPVLSMTDGSIAGCQCMDRVFYKRTEDWGTHLAEVFEALILHRTEQGEPSRDREAQALSEAEEYVRDTEPSKRAETVDDFMTGWRTADRTRVQGEPSDDLAVAVDGLEYWAKNAGDAAIRTDCQVALDYLRRAARRESIDDYEAGYAEGFHHGRSTPREPQGDQDERSDCESDERVQAWEQITKHSIFHHCYDDERPLIASMLARLDTLKDLEETVNELAPAPRIEPTQAQVIAALEAYGHTEYDLIHPPGHRMYDALRAAAETGGEHRG